MTAYGVFHDGRIEMEPGCEIPEGSRVKVEVLLPPTRSGNGLADMFARYDEAVKHVPQEEWDKLPADGGLNHDHYLYGAPKRDAR